MYRQIERGLIIERILGVTDKKVAKKYQVRHLKESGIPGDKGREREREIERVRKKERVRKREIERDIHEWKGREGFEEKKTFLKEERSEGEKEGKRDIKVD